jgi:hypothetical protein
MSKRLLLINLVLAVVAALVVADLVRELSGSRRLPAAPVPRVVPSAPAGDGTAAAPATVAPDARPQWNVIATRSLFNPSRTEAPTTPAVAAAPPPKLFLHGVVLDDGRSRAFLEDATSKKVFGYAIGDQIGGGRIETISADRVVIARPEGKVDVLLRDPSKPQPPAQPAVAGATPGLVPGAPVPAGSIPVSGRSNPFQNLIPPPATPPPTPPTPGQTVTPPSPQQPQRLFQGVSPDFFRRAPNPGNPEGTRPNQGG